MHWMCFVWMCLLSKTLRWDGAIMCTWRWKYMRHRYFCFQYPNIWLLETATVTYKSLPEECDNSFVKNVKHVQIRYCIKKWITLFRNFGGRPSLYQGRQLSLMPFRLVDTGSLWVPENLSIVAECAQAVSAHSGVGGRCCLLRWGHTTKSKLQDRVQICPDSRSENPTCLIWFSSALAGLRLSRETSDFVEPFTPEIMCCDCTL